MVITISLIISQVDEILNYRNCLIVIFYVDIYI